MDRKKKGEGETEIDIASVMAQRDRKGENEETGREKKTNGTGNWKRRKGRKVAD